MKDILRQLRIPFLSLAYSVPIFIAYYVYHDDNDDDVDDDDYI